MAKYCKNCAALITDNDVICPDCGKEIPNNYRNNLNYCPNCGESVNNTENFCSACGKPLKSNKKEKKSPSNYLKNPIFVVAIIGIIAIIALLSIGNISLTNSQDVQVDNYIFSIPGDFKYDASESFEEDDTGIHTSSKYWTNSNDFIEIDVMYSIDNNVDANAVAKKMGGQKQTMYSYDGYYNEFSDAYSFAYVKDNKLITIYVSDYNLFDEILVE